MATTKIFICADASPQIGAGHVMRCMALAQAAQRQELQIHMVCRVSSIWVRERLGRENIPFTLLPGKIPQQECPSVLFTNLSSLGAVEGDWVCLDGYHFAEDCHKAVLAMGLRLLVIDDHAHLSEYHCDILLNQNLGAEEFDYRGSVGVTLLGPRFALLRTEFIEARNSIGTREFPLVPQKILISLGGGDQTAELRCVLTALSKYFNSGMKVKIVPGSMGESEVHATAAFIAFPLALAKTDDIVAEMLWADLAITAGGSTCWELCCLGTPFMVFSLADNQTALTRHLQEQGIALAQDALSFIFNKNTQNRLSDQSSIGKLLVSGDGVDALVHTILGHSAWLRPARPEDCDFLLNLVNKPEIRKFAGTPQNVTCTEHRDWFRARLLSPLSYIFIVCTSRDCRKVGYIRFEALCGEATLSVALEPSYQRHGLGLWVITEGCLALQRAANGCVSIITANVRGDNPRALCVFAKAGFRRVGAATVRSSTALVKMQLAV